MYVSKLAYEQIFIIPFLITIFSNNVQLADSPRAMPQVDIYGLVLGQTAFVNVTVGANPRPRTEWIVAGLPIPQGTQIGRYESNEPVDLGNGQFNVTLTIASLTLEDTTKNYYLKASNQYGTQDYTIRISSSEEEASILDTGSIVGIVVAIAVVLIAVVLIIFARVTGRWCFGGE